MTESLPVAKRIRRRKLILQEKHGDPYKMSNAYIKKTTVWPAMSAGDDAASPAYIPNSVRACHGIHVVPLYHPQNLVRKFQLYLQNRWRRRVVIIRASEYRMPSFRSFADFITQEVKVATDPVFSKEALANTDTKVQRRKSVKPVIKSKRKSLRSYKSCHQCRCIVYNSPSKVQLEIYFM